MTSPADESSRSDSPESGLSADARTETEQVAASATDGGPPAQPRRLLLQVLSGAAAFFFGYVITAGPAVFIARRFDQPMFDRIVQVLYAPLILLVKARVPLVSPVIEAWVGLFR